MSVVILKNGVKSNKIEKTCICCSCEFMYDEEDVSEWGMIECPWCGQYLNHISTNTKTLDESNIIDELLNCINFEKIQNNINRKKWFVNTHGLAIPSIESIRKKAETLIKQSIHQKQSIKDKTGFIVMYKENMDGTVTLSIDFSIESAEVQII